MDLNQKQEYTEGIDEYLEEYKVYDYFYELMKEILIHRPKNPLDFLIERISKSETKRWVIVGPPGFSQLGLGRLVAGKIGWKYLSMTDWIEKDIDDIRKKESENVPQPPKPREKKVEKPKETPPVKQEEKQENVAKTDNDQKPADSKEVPKKEDGKSEVKADAKPDPKVEPKTDHKDSKAAGVDKNKKDVKADKKEESKGNKDSKAKPEEEKKEVEQKVEVQEPPAEVEPEEIKSREQELKEHMLQFRNDLIADDTYSDIINRELYDNILINVHGQIKAGFISDKSATAVFKKNVKEFEHESWILEGYPKTRTQALALSKNKVIPDKIFLMKYSDEVALGHILDKLKEKHAEDVPEEKLMEAAQLAIEEYHINIKEVEDLFKNVIHIIDAHGYVKGYSEDQNKVSHFVDELSRHILMKRISPDRRLRVIIVGAPGSGRSTQAARIAQKYNLVHVSTSNLLKNEIRLKTEKGKRIKECFTGNKLVPDEIICSLIETRIKQNDCKLNGWVLDGFPKTIQQITVLKAMKVKPTRVIVLECDKEICSDRILNRLFDPVTGKIYIHLNEAPEDKEIRSRLMPYFADMTKDKVEKRWNLWNQFQIKVEESYQDLVLKFNTEEYPIEHVTDHICEYLQNPLF